MVHPFEKIVGIELIEPLHQLAVKLMQSYTDKFGKQSNIELIHGDMTK